MRLRVAMLACALLTLTTSPTLAQQPPAQQPAPQQPAPGQPAPVQPVPLQPIPPQPVPPAPRRIVPGQSLAGILVGSPLHIVLARFGRPSVIRETALDTVYDFSRWGIVVYANNGRVTAASTSNSLLKIDDNVGVGYRVEDVLAAFGRGFRDGTVENFPGMIYDGRGVAFGLDRRGVAIVIVFRADTASRVSGLLPGGVAPPAVAGFPNVAGLRPWSAETNYLSLPGYLRWIVFHASGIWITFGEAARVVQEQQAAAR